jgi:hypothetical protein
MSDEITEYVEYLLESGCDKDKLYVKDQCSYYHEPHIHGVTLCCSAEVCDRQYYYTGAIKVECTECKETRCVFCTHRIERDDLCSDYICQSCEEKHTCMLCYCTHRKFLSVEDRHFCLKCKMTMCKDCYDRCDLCTNCYKDVKEKIINKYLIEEGIIKDLNKIIQDY